MLVDVTQSRDHRRRITRREPGEMKPRDGWELGVEMAWTTQAGIIEAMLGSALLPVCILIKLFEVFVCKKYTQILQGQYLDKAVVKM